MLMVHSMRKAAARKAGPSTRTQPGDCLMDASVISALAALAGAAIGGLTSVFASWLTQRAQARAEWLAQERLRRQELYKEFIEEASKSYIDALQHDKADIAALVGLYAKISRMRILSPPRVVESAEQISRKIVDTYLAPDKTFVELREMANDGSLDLLRDFSEACRADFDSLRAQQFQKQEARWLFRRPDRYDQ